MTVQEAALLLGRTYMWVACGLRDDKLPIGAGVLMPGGRWKYDVRPERLAAYMGITMLELRLRLDELKDDDKAG